MKRLLLFIVVLVFLGGVGSVFAKTPEPPRKESTPVVSSRDGLTPYIEYLRGDFGGPWWADGWLWVKPGQRFRLSWRAGDVRWCNKWGDDFGFRGPARARGEYWVQLSKPNPRSAHGGWGFGLTCGNGVVPNAHARIWVKVIT